jgi:hypothetical protein
MPDYWCPFCSNRVVYAPPDGIATCPEHGVIEGYKLREYWGLGIWDGDSDVLPCGCEYHSAAPDPGIWFPCARAKANGFEHCMSEEMREDSDWRDEEPE